MSKSPNPEMQKEWELRIASLRASKLTQEKWCEVNNLTINQLKYWIRKIEGPRSTRKSNHNWVPLILEKEDDVPNETLQVKVGPASIEVKPGFNPSLLADVVKVLKTIC